MNAAIAIGVIIVAVAFAVLELYLAQTLKSTQRTLNNDTDTLAEEESRVEGINTETTLLLQTTNDLAEDVNHKVVRLNSVFEGVEEVGDTFNNLTRSMKKLSNSISVSSEEDVEKATEAVKWSTAIMNIWRNRKS